MAPDGLALHPLRLLCCRCSAFWLCLSLCCRLCALPWCGHAPRRQLDAALCRLLASAGITGCHARGARQRGRAWLLGCALPASMPPVLRQWPGLRLGCGCAAEGVGLRRQSRVKTEAGRTPVDVRLRGSLCCRRHLLLLCGSRLRPACSHALQLGGRACGGSMDRGQLYQARALLVEQAGSGGRRQGLEGSDCHPRPCWSAQGCSRLLPRSPQPIHRGRARPCSPPSRSLAGRPPGRTLTEWASWCLPACPAPRRWCLQQCGAAAGPRTAAPRSCLLCRPSALPGRWMGRRRT